MSDDRGLSERVRREVERIVEENWTVDGPFVTTLDEVASKVRSEFGMSSHFLNLLCLSILLGAEEIFQRKDVEELARLTVRMFLTGLLQGGRWQREKGQW